MSDRKAALPEASRPARRVGHIDPSALADAMEVHRLELRAHCYRMLGSLADAEDAVQDTYLRAWRAFGTFRGETTIRRWLYRIATNVCLDDLEKRPRRVLPDQVVAPSDPRAPAEPGDDDGSFLQPYPDQQAATSAEPEAHVVRRESVELAFLTAIHLLPPRQRAVLLLRDVLEWSAKEVAELLGMTPVGVHSTLQRARAAIGRPERRRTPTDGVEERLAAKLIDAWERADVASLVDVLREGARLVMPPSPSWYVGRAAIADFFSGVLTPGAFRVLPTRANGHAALALYERGAATAGHHGTAIVALTFDDGAVTRLTGFVCPELFPLFGLPSWLPPTRRV